MEKRLTINGKEFLKPVINKPFQNRINSRGKRQEINYLTIEYEISWMGKGLKPKNQEIVNEKCNLETKKRSFASGLTTHGQGINF